MDIVNSRKTIKHPNIVSIRDFFQTKEFDKLSFDSVVVYDYSSGAETLEQHYFVQTNRAPQGSEKGDDQLLRRGNEREKKKAHND